MQNILLHSGEKLSRVMMNPAEDLEILQEADSTLCLYLVATATSTCHVHVRQLGAGCTTRIYGLAYVSGTDEVVFHTDVEHTVGGSTSEQLLKFVLGDHARGDFYGRLLIAEDAQQTTALQTNRNLLLSPTAVMRTRPQLEIYADDVKASHGASTGQLDETALFYMRQRGVDYETARKLLIGAFLYEIVNTVEDEGERNEVITSLGLSQN